MKKREIFLIVALVLFGVIYQAVEKGKARFAGDFSFYTNERKLKGSRFAEFREPEKLFSAVAKLTIKNPAGEIVISRSDDGQVHLVSLLRVYYSEKNDVERLREKASIKTDLNGDGLKISVHYPPPFPYQRLRVFFRLQVPEDTMLDISNQEGDVIVRGTGKGIRISEENGSLFMEGIRSKLELQLRNCIANMKDIADHAEITASHSNINIENAVSLRLEGSHGNCMLKNVEKDVFVEYSFGKLILDGAGKVEIAARHSDISARNIRGGAVVSNRYEGIFMENIIGDIRLSGRSSKIDLRHVSGGNVVMENSYADSSILDFSGNNLDLLVKNGNLDLQVKDVTDRINIQSQNAALSLEFGVLSDPTFNIRTRHGRIFVDSPLQLESYEENEIQFANRAGQKPEILINNIYGDVHVKSSM